MDKKIMYENIKTFKIRLYTTSKKKWRISFTYDTLDHRYNLMFLAF